MHGSIDFGGSVDGFDTGGGSVATDLGSEVSTTLLLEGVVDTSGGTSAAAGRRHEDDDNTSGLRHDGGGETTPRLLEKVKSIVSDDGSDKLVSE